MKRRQFLLDTGKIAVGIGVFGSIRWKEDRYIGDTPTTTDILGPFYRPNAPLRTNINPKGYSGKLFHLTGTVFKQDGKTPFKNCTVEIWQCDSNKVYDNTSDEFRYRGAQKTNNRGEYHFITSHPIPYNTPEEPDRYRPAHIHLRLSGDGQQDLVTQIYFKEDPYVEKDRHSSKPGAASRILPVTKNDKGEEQVLFNVVMAKEFKPSDQFFATVSGIYKVKDGLWEFYRQGDLLFFKGNGQIQEVLYYSGSNEFRSASGQKMRFDVGHDGTVKLCLLKADGTGCSLEAVKVFKY